VREKGAAYQWPGQTAINVRASSRTKRPNKFIDGESRGLVVKLEDSQLRGCGFEPRRRILNGVRDAIYYKLQWKKEIKVAKWGTPKKYLRKKKKKVY
jgi:hypothetical protein